MTISAKIIQDSYSPFTQARVTTFELEYPRFIHSEFMTHHAIVKNSASSRAIPVETMIANIMQNPAMPIHWGKAQPGMQAYEEHDQVVIYDEDDCEAKPETAWRIAMLRAVDMAKAFAKAGYHKQVVNRLTEPFQHMKVVATATDWNNFFWLRNHPDAQPEIHELARQMQEAYETNRFHSLNENEWHLPYLYRFRRIDTDGINKLQYALDPEGIVFLNVEDAKKVSASLCAQVSYRKTDDSLGKATAIYDRLVKSTPVHASPFEHQAMCFNPRDMYYYHDSWIEGITHMNRNGDFYSGNLRGFIQHRQLIPNNVKLG